MSFQVTDGLFLRVNLRLELDDLLVLLLDDLLVLGVFVGFFLAEVVDVIFRLLVFLLSLVVVRLLGRWRLPG